MGRRRERDGVDCRAWSRAPRQDPENAAKPAPAGCSNALQVAQVRAGRAPGPSKNRFDLTMDPQGTIMFAARFLR